MVVCCLPAAAENRVSKMEIDVALRRDGSAAVTQVWTADTDSGTEFYLACRDSGYLTITDFSVSDESGTYALLEEWDVDASFEEKAGKCGVHETEDGVELCWGIGEYGPRQYTVSYVLHGLVGAYDDADGFNHRFVDEMTTFPTNVSLTIRSEDGAPLADENCDIWAFGYDGQIRFEDGAIHAWTETALDGSENMTVMVALKKEVLSPLRNEDGSFEEIKDRAFEGSDYDNEEEGGFLDLLLGLAIFLGVGVCITMGAVIAAKRRKAKLNKRTKQVEYFRDAPNNGNLNVTHRLGSACELCREDSLLGAYLLRLISDGALEPEESDSNARQADMRLVRPPRNGNPYDDAFYTILEAAAGADGVLQAKELERFCDQNARPLAGFVDSCRKDADRTMIHAGCYRGAVCQGVKSLTEQGRQQAERGSGSGGSASFGGGGGFSGGGAGVDLSGMLNASGIPDSLEAIKGDTGAIKRSAALSEEDMKLFVDMAERQYVNKINLTAQTPVITINGQNTGNTAEDLQWLENALQRILLEQAASHTDLSYQ